MELTLHLPQRLVLIYMCVVAISDRQNLWLGPQNGLQPIHHAAQEGHEEVVRMLIEDFHVKPDSTSNVSLKTVQT